MPKRVRRTDFSSLAKKYQGFSVVNEIEKNLLSKDERTCRAESLVLSDLYHEDSYDLERYEVLEKSIRNDGFLMPLIVVKKDDRYEIINGVKRFLLARKIGLESMPIVLADLPEERKIAYIIENIMSEGDNPLVKTYAFQVLESKYAYPDDKIAELSSLSVNQVRNLKRLDKLPDFLKDGLKDFVLTYSEARSLLNLPLERQKELYEKIRKGEVSVRDLEKEKRTYLGNKRKRKVTLRNKRVTISFESEEEAEKFYPQIVRLFSD